mgnify:CR=1 FL=1
MPRPTLPTLLQGLAKFGLQCGCAFVIICGLFTIHPGLLMVAAGSFFFAVSERW